MKMLVHEFADKSAESLSRPDFQMVFRDIDFVVRNLNEVFLAKMQAQFASFPYEEAWKMNVGELFIPHVPFLGLYMDYYTKHDQALDLIQKLRTDKHPVWKVWDAAAKRCKGRNIESLLIMPVQRIPRYNLLLRELIKNTPEDDMPEELANCQKALEMSKKVTKHFDEAVEKRVNTMDILEVKKKFKPELEFLDVSDDRTLLLQGYVKLVDRHHNKRYIRGEHLAVLFSDMLVIGRKMLNGSHTLEEHLTPSAALGNETKYRIRVAGEPCTEHMSPSVHLSFEHHDQPRNTYSEWMKHLDKMCNEKLAEDTTRAVPAKPKISRTLSTPLTSILRKHQQKRDKSPKNSKHPAFHRLQAPTRRFSQPQLPVTLKPSPIRRDSPLPTNNSVKWERDADVSHCRICDKEFSLLIRHRHHCRKCGRIICGDCSPYRVDSSEFNISDQHKKVRVCTECFDNHSAHAEEDPSGQNKPLSDPVLGSNNGPEAEKEINVASTKPDTDNNTEANNVDTPVAPDHDGALKAPRHGNYDSTTSHDLMPVTTLNHEAPPPPSESSAQAHFSDEEEDKTADESADESASWNRRRSIGRHRGSVTESGKRSEVAVTATVGENVAAEVKRLLDSDDDTEEAELPQQEVVESNSETEELITPLGRVEATGDAAKVRPIGFATYPFL